MKQLITRWGKDIDKNNVHKEYPRPQMVRDSYYNLNGEWDCAINKSPEVKEYTDKILVPFSPEAYLSGVNKIVMPDDYLHYHTQFKLPEGFMKDRLILHFGAVDQECEVYLNDVKIGEHIGGYLPFSFDVSSVVVPDAENTLKLRVVDKTEQAPHARGKQKLVKKGKYGSLFYTPNSGIWKTVWLESVADNYITKVKLTPLYDEEAVQVNVKTNNLYGEANVRIMFEGNLISESTVETNKDNIIKIEKVYPWTPDTPNLYDVQITYGEDSISSYFGMRKYSVGKDTNGILRFFLNNEPVFFNGLLDQGYWPEGLLTAPSDEALKYDILKTKELGYNTIRKHIKIEPERFYYHCDKVGMIVWQDMPNGGGEYNMGFVTYLPNASNTFGRIIKDSSYSLFKRADEIGRKQFDKDLEGMVELLYNYPSIAVWVPFNEGWGQFDAAKATERIKKIDDTRLINEACGWFDQGGGDMYSIHKYIRKLKVKPNKDRVVAVTEFGGYSYPVKGHLAATKEFGYKTSSSSEELTENYKILWEEQIIPNINNGLSAAIYTQTTDIEEEINGLMTYDREVNKMQEDTVKTINKQLYEEFNTVVNSKEKIYGSMTSGLAEENR